MCGIAGLWTPQGAIAPDAQLRLVERFAESLRHRGPDAGGVWGDGAAGLALGARRLAVIDLSANGAQPMLSASGRYTLVYNGEIYNYRELRAELDAGGATRWRGGSDTEVLLAALERFAVAGALERADGMFALALWDAADRVLHLARDRGGEKPLYYGFVGDTFIFGSELKPFRLSPGWTGALDHEAVALYFRYGYVPAPWSIYAGIRKLSAAHHVAIAERDVRARSLPAPSSYWRAEQSVPPGGSNAQTWSEAEILAQLDERLGRAVSQRMVADVPIGCFLSGGVDSSLIANYMQRVAGRPIRTFSIGFLDAKLDESKHGAAVAQHLGTQHNSLIVTANEATEVIPKIPELTDEPYADFSIIPTFLLSRLARSNVTVALTGDGGDELFGGYARHFLIDVQARRLQPIPPLLRRGLARAISVTPDFVHDAFGAVLRPILRMAGFGFRVQGSKVARRIAFALGEAGSDAYAQHLMSVWMGGRDSPLRSKASPPLDPVSPRLDGIAFATTGERAALHDLLMYLPDNLFTKVDRASMAVSLETRAPFVARDFVEYALQVPWRYKLAGGVGKRVLRHLLYRYVPRSLVDRPKMGFSPPLREWLLGPLAGWVDELAGERVLAADPYLDGAAVRAEHAALLRYEDPHLSRLWTVLMFQAWRRNFHH